MLEAILVLAVLGAVWRAYAVGVKHGREERESASLKAQEAALTGESEAVGKTVGIPFYYHDFRVGWKTGIEESKRLNLYRQQYCGCIYSEKQRFYHPDRTAKIA